MIHFAFLEWNDRDHLFKSKSTETHKIEFFRIEFKRVQYDEKMNNIITIDRNNGIRGS